VPGFTKEGKLGQPLFMMVNTKGKVPAPRGQLTGQVLLCWPQLPEDG
jgi:hypothetical protein